MRPCHPFPSLELGGKDVTALWPYQSRSRSSSNGSIERGARRGGRQDHVYGYGQGFAVPGSADSDIAPASSDRSAATDVAEVSFDMEEQSDAGTETTLEQGPGDGQEVASHTDIDSEQEEQEQEQEQEQERGAGGYMAVEGASDSDQEGEEGEVTVVFSLENREGSRLYRKRCKDSLTGVAFAGSSSSSPRMEAATGLTQAMVSPCDPMDDTGTSDDECEDEEEQRVEAFGEEEEKWNMRPTKRSRSSLVQKDCSGSSPDSLQSLSLGGR